MDQKLKKLEEIQELLARAWRMAYDLREEGDISSPVYELRNKIVFAEIEVVNACRYLKESGK